jgi:GNAT superfamily N-acetyltransferase
MTLGNPDRPVGGIAVRPPEGVELRPLGRDDLADAVALARAGRGLTPLADLAPLGERYEALINSVDTVAFLAVTDAAAAGLAVLHLRRRLNFATFEGWLSDLWVMPGAAGRGIEDALLRAVVAEWRLRGGHRIIVPFHRDDAACRAALVSEGFEEAFLDFEMAPVAVDAPGVDGLSIRPLTLDDADAVTRLIAEFGPRRSPVPDRMEAVLRTYAAHARDVEAGRAASIVADLEDRTVGVCTLEWQRPFWTEDLHAWIPDLVVTEPVRGRGIGRALMAAALSAATDAGAALVTIESGEQRLSAQALYRSLGFAEPGRSWILRREE